LEDKEFPLNKKGKKQHKKENIFYLFHLIIIRKYLQTLHRNFINYMFDRKYWSRGTYAYQSPGAVSVLVSCLHGEYLTEPLQPRFKREQCIRFQIIATKVRTRLRHAQYTLYIDIVQNLHNINRYEKESWYSFQRLSWYEHVN